jgi:chromosome segregation ATPase
MKKVVILLAVLAVGLAYALYRATQNAGTITQQAQTQLGVSSNRIAELEMKLNHQEQLARSLGSQVTNHLEELGQRTAELNRLRTALAKWESETRDVQASLAATVPVRQRLEVEVAGLKARIGELESSLAESTTKNRALADELAALNSQRNALALQLAQARQESATLETRLQNPDFLEAQIEAIDAEADRRASTNRAPPVASPRSQAAAPAKSLRSANVATSLELQPDGSVRAVPAN